MSDLFKRIPVFQVYQLVPTSLEDLDSGDYNHYLMVPAGRLLNSADIALQRIISLTEESAGSLSYMLRPGRTRGKPDGAQLIGFRLLLRSEYDQYGAQSHQAEPIGDAFYTRELAVSTMIGMIRETGGYHAYRIIELESEDMITDERRLLGIYMEQRQLAENSSGSIRIAA